MFERSARRRIPSLITLATLSLASLAIASGRPGPSPSELERIKATILVTRFQRCVQERDPDGFAQEVAAAFPEKLLGRWVREGDADTRRAAVYALGFFGSFQVNDDVARGLKDPDAVVRAMADRALRAIWFRADLPENNDRLRKVMSAIEAGDHDRAIREADELIQVAPRFAEAYNQRAIAHFFSGRHERSAADCRKTLDLNPHHLGALSGLGQCLLRLDRPAEAARVYRQALRVSPYDVSLQEIVAELEGRR